MIFQFQLIEDEPTQPPARMELKQARRVIRKEPGGFRLRALRFLSVCGPRYLLRSVSMAPAATAVPMTPATFGPIACMRM